MWVRHDALLQVADLGLATVADKASSAISQTSTKAGTNHYFSPQKMLEQHLGPQVEKVGRLVKQQQVGLMQQ